jgi:acyl-CoA hydrolase
MKEPKEVTAAEALSTIKSNDKVFIQTAAGCPRYLVHEMCKLNGTVKDVNLYHLHTEGEAPYAREEYSESFKINAFFVGSNTRKAIQAGRGSYIPIFLSEIPYLFKRDVIPLNKALVQVSPPDQHGYCSLGVSVDTTKSALLKADVVIAQVNKYVPRTHGDAMIRLDDLDYLVYKDEELPYHHPKPISAEEERIGQFAAGIIEDRATLQMGIGSIPDAVLKYLDQHKDLGIHTEMFSDGILPLVEKGIITGKYKKKHPGSLVSSFLIGSKKLYDFVDDNPSVKMLESDYVNKVDVIRRNPKVTAINSAIEIDLSGQVCADSIGSTIYSGVGGQMDFIRGASLCENGKPIIAMTSTSHGESKIVSMLKPGAGVVTTRAHIHYVVTEYGVVNLYGKSIKERTKLLISIAHPNHREALEKQSFQLRYH